MKVLYENCDKEKANDTSLPYTAYLVTYKVDGKERYDVTISKKGVELFDYYYDLYKKDFVTFIQTKGNINHRLWQDQSEAKKPTKKKKTR